MRQLFQWKYKEVRRLLEGLSKPYCTGYVKSIDYPEQLHNGKTIRELCSIQTFVYSPLRLYGENMNATLLQKSINADISFLGSDFSSHPYFYQLRFSFLTEALEAA